MKTRSRANGRVSAPLEPPAWVRGLRAITFDFGNTLVPVGRGDLERVVRRTLDRAVVGADAPERERERAWIAWTEERDRQLHEEVAQLREFDMHERFVRIFARLRGMAVPDRSVRWDDAAAARFSGADEIDAAVEAYTEAFVEEIPAVPEVGPFLATISSRYAVGILSNWPVAAAIDRYVDAAGWRESLAAIVVSERVGAVKPLPAIFRAAEAALAPALGVDPVGPGEILHVGDDWAADVVGAKAVGWRAAFLHDRPGDSPLPGSVRDDRADPDLELDRLGELTGRLGLGSLG